MPQSRQSRSKPTAHTQSEPTSGRVLVVKSQPELDAALAGTTGPVALEFVQKGCGYCEEEAPKVDALTQKCGGVTVLRVDVDDMPKLADEYLGDDGGTPTIFYAPSSAELKPGVATEMEDSDALKRRLKCAR